MKLKRITFLTVLSIATICCSSCGPTGALTKLEVTKQPDKLTYTVGETFSTRGMVVTGTYYDAQKDVETKANYGNYYYWCGDENGKLRLGDDTVKITDVNDYNSKIYTTVSITVTNGEPGPGPGPGPSPYTGDYYDSITDDMTGQTLLNALYDIIHPAKCKTAYGAIWDYLPYCDAANPDVATNDGKITAFYRGTPGSKSDMNKEHVWPKSRGGESIEGDPHMVRPTFSSDNSSRGNSAYVEGMCHSSNGWDPKADGMNESYRGDSARIIFYCAVQEKDKLSLQDKNNPDIISTSKGNMGKLSDLLKWNLSYAVQERERLRNDVLNGTRKSHGRSFTFNRNPFIDHPEYACRIWGTTNATTRQICGM